MRNTIKKKPILILILLFIIIISSVQLFTYKSYKDKKEQYVKSRVELVQEHYNVTYQTFKTNATHFYNSIINNPKIMQVLKDANSQSISKQNKARIKLTKMFHAKYQLVSKLGIDLIHFHLPNNKSFFRRHKKDKFGDDLTSYRYSVAQTNKYKTNHDGLEVGIYNHAFRFVFPIIDKQNNHIGSVEGSVSSEAFMKYMESASRIHTHFVIKKDAINLNNKELMKKYVKTNGLTDCLRLKTIAKRDFKHTMQEKKQIKAKMANYDKSRKDPSVITVQKNGKEEIVIFIPILNTKKNKTIAYCVAYDDKNDLEYIKDDYLVHLIIGFLISLLLTYLIFKILMSKYDLEQEVNIKTQELKDLNENLEIMIEEKTEKLENSLNIISKNVIYSRTDLQGNIIEVSDAFCKISQYTKEELIGQPHNIVRHIDVPESVFKDMWSTIKSGIVWSGELINRKKDGGYYWVEVTISPEFNKKGEIVSFIAIRHDITAKKDFEQQHTKLLKSEKLASMGEMIGNIAHQWRQPLSVISTSATGMLVEKEFDVLTDEKFRKSCDDINNHAQYLSKTIDDFRNFIKGDRTKKLFSLTEAIDSFFVLIEGTVKSNHINMIIDLQNNIKIDGYESELTQCVINIFNNAKDALNENNVTNKFIFITAVEQDNKVIIKIKDNAGGIPNNILPKIFEPYFTTKHKSQGTGLGLHMTYNLIVDGMNGTVEASNVDYEYNSKNYTGAEFKICLPIN